MKKKLIIILTIIVTIFLVCKIDTTISAAGSNLTYTQTKALMDANLEVTNEMYATYTNTESYIYDPSYLNLNINIYDYYDKDYGYIAFNIQYTTRNKAVIHDDDLITGFVPKELFIHRGSYTVIGKEYGFYVDCKSYSDEKLINKIDVFIFDINFSYSNKQVNSKVIPLFAYTYYYISDYAFKNNTSINNISLTSVSSLEGGAVIPVPGTLNSVHGYIYGGISYLQNFERVKENHDKYGIRDSTSVLLLNNINNLNETNSNYNGYDDKGYRIVSSFVDYKGMNTDTYLSKIDLEFEILNFVSPLIDYDLLDIILYFRDIDKSEELIGKMLFKREKYWIASEPNPTLETRGDTINEQIDWAYNNNIVRPLLWKFDTINLNVNSNEMFFGNTFYHEMYPYTHLRTYINYVYQLDYVENYYTELQYGLGLEIIKQENGESKQVGYNYSTRTILIGDNDSKEIKMDKQDRGYILNQNYSQTFLFNPTFPGYYEFICNTEDSTSFIELYEDNVLVDSQYDYCSYYFDKNKTYKFVIKTISDNLIFNVELKPREYQNHNSLTLTHYSDNNIKENIIKVSLNKTDMYIIEFDFGITPFNVNFKILDNNLNIIQKYFIQSNENNAINSNEKKYLYAYLEKNKSYYILYDYPANPNLIKLKFYEVNNYSFEEEQNTILVNSSDFFTSLTFKYTSKYHLTYTFQSSTYNSNDNMYFLIFKKISTGINMLYFKKVTSGNEYIEMDFNFNANDSIYFGFFNGTNSGTINYEFSIPIDYEFHVMTDPFWADKSAPIGTEVTVNNKGYYGTTIAVGFTRILYLCDDAIYSSRFNDYNWVSTDPTVATVSAYGTIMAKSEGTTIIRVTDKYSKNHFASITITVYNLNISGYVTVGLSTDVNLDPSLNGTEVSSGLGSSNSITLHKGYTRSICIVSGGPTILRQDYNWYSSDSSIAIVNEYGIVTGLKSGTITITCINKYENAYIGTITIIVL